MRCGRALRESGDRAPHTGKPAMLRTEYAPRSSRHNLCRRQRFWPARAGLLASLLGLWIISYFYCIAFGWKRNSEYALTAAVSRGEVLIEWSDVAGRGDLESLQPGWFSIAIGAIALLPSEDSPDQQVDFWPPVSRHPWGNPRYQFVSRFRSIGFTWQTSWRQSSRHSGAAGPTQHGPIASNTFTAPIWSLTLIVAMLLAIPILYRWRKMRTGCF